MRVLIVVCAALLLGSCSGDAVDAIASPSAPSVTAAAPPKPRPPVTTTMAATPSTVTTKVVPMPVAPEETSTIAADPAGDPGPPPRDRIVMHGVGDVGLSSAQHWAFVQQGYEIAWSGLDGLFERDDLTIINLECSPSALGRPLVKTYAFRCDPEALPVAAAAGVDVANLGNNHSGDFGREALVDGRASLFDAGIVPVGAGADLAEANRPARFEVGGWRVAVVGMSSIPGGDGWWAGPEWPGVAFAGHDNAAASVSAAAADADIVIVTVHWGIEAWTGPTEADRERAAVMIAAGADVIIGHHSHQLQPLEMIGDVPVFWSLGDFIWPVLDWRSEESAVAEIVVETDGAISARMIPAYIVSHGHPELRGSPDPSLGAPMAPVD